ncbi:MAG: hypothetical protein Q9181_001992, partial [Wetmoreana brouardii]
FLDSQVDVKLTDPFLAAGYRIVKLLGKYKQLDKVIRPPEWGALGRFPFDLVFDGEVVGDGAFDIDAEIQTDGIWMLQIEMQGPGDSVFPYHPSGLLLLHLEGEALIFRRIGYFTLNEDNRSFFDSMESDEINLI